MDFGIMRGKAWSNAKLDHGQDAFIIKTGLRIIPDFVDWIRVMQAFERQF